MNSGQPSANVQQSEGTGETILVVDDQQIVLQATVAILQRAGYNVLGALTGAEAKDICDRRQAPIHLLLTDLLMPGIDGPEVVRSVKAIDPRVRIVYMSGYPRDMLADRGILLDRDSDFLAKPFTPAGLKSKIREVLDRSQRAGA